MARWGVFRRSRQRTGDDRHHNQPIDRERHTHVIFGRQRDSQEHWHVHWDFKKETRQATTYRITNRPWPSRYGSSMVLFLDVGHWRNMGGGG